MNDIRSAEALIGLVKAGRGSCKVEIVFEDPYRYIPDVEKGDVPKPPETKIRLSLHIEAPREEVRGALFESAWQAELERIFNP